MSFPPYYRAWWKANGHGPWPCFGCGDEVTGLGGMSGTRRRDAGVIHHHDGDHGNNELSNLRVMHHRCHAQHHHTRNARNPYMQIAAQLRDGIASGRYGDPLPSVKAIAKEAGVATGTVNRAYKLLTDEGLVYSVPGRGMFVRKESSQ